MRSHGSLMAHEICARGHKPPALACRPATSIDGPAYLARLGVRIRSLVCRHTYSAYYASLILPGVETAANGQAGGRRYLLPLCHLKPLLVLIISNSIETSRMALE